MLDPYVIARLWWGLLVLSVLLTFVAVPLRSWKVAVAAVICSLAFAQAALASIGLLILILTALQGVVAYLLYRGRSTAQVGQ